MQFWQYSAIVASIFISGIAGLFLAHIAHEEIDELKSEIMYVCTILLSGLIVLMLQRIIGIGWQFSLGIALVAAIAIYLFDPQRLIYRFLERWYFLAAALFALILGVVASPLAAFLVMAYYMLSATLNLKKKESLSLNIRRILSRDFYFPLFAFMAYAVLAV